MRHLALLAVIVAAPIAAQDNAVVTGRITNAQGSALAGVSVRLLPDGSRASTDAGGTYRLVVPAARIRAGQDLAITAGRAGLGVRSASTRGGCDSLVVDLQMAPRPRATRADAGLRLDTEVLRRCARMREEGAVLRRVDLREAGDHDVLTTLGEVVGLRYSYGTAGGRPTLRIGGRSADIDPTVYVDGRPVEPGFLARMRASEAEAIWIRPGHLPGRPGEPAAPGGSIRVMRTSHGVSADSLLQRLDGFWWPPLPPRSSAVDMLNPRPWLERGGMLRRADLQASGDLLTGLANAGAFRPAKVGGRPVRLIGADSTVSAEPVVYVNGVRVALDQLGRIPAAEADSVEIRPAGVPAPRGLAAGPGGVVLVWRRAPAPRD